MFVMAIVLAIIIGLLLKGSLKNLENLKLNKISFIFIAFIIEFFIIILTKNGVVEKGTLTLVVDFIMYILIFSFIYFNRKDKFIVVMGFGFLLNAIPIFANGGAMPISAEALKSAGLNVETTQTGLYKLIDSSTKFAYLGDIIPSTFLRRTVMSIGDIISALAMMIVVILNMKKNTN
ncbi:hypothetical protein SH2C18_22590 [Clostridium sediminicola]|uniref:DUF5317 family protein n=1 Tax=Clostridium sediminicola TaxID=3114879 RepID=UPI0031F24A40